MVKRLCALFFSLWIGTNGLTLTAGGEYQFDNYVFDKKKYDLSASGIPLFSGNFCGGFQYDLSRMQKEISGLSPFQDEAASARLCYARSGRRFTAGADMSAGLWNNGAAARSFYMAVLPFKVQGLPGDLQWLTTLQFRSGAADDNPVAMRMDITKQSAGADIGAGFRGWELHADYQEDYYSSISRKAYQPFLEDTLFFQTFYDVLNPFLNLMNVETTPIPSNTIRQISVYFFGSLRPWLYLGGAYSHKNSNRDFYLPIADAGNGRLTFAYFPYKTPKQERVFRIILDFIKSWQKSESIINEISSKLSLPVYSKGTYRGYYISPTGNVIEGFEEFYYNYSGTGEMAFETGVRKSVGHGCSIKATYSWVSRPYKAYHFFGTDSYQYHAIGLKIIKDFGSKD